MNTIDKNAFYVYLSLETYLLSKAGIAIKWSYAPIPTELSIASIERRITTL